MSQIGRICRILWRLTPLVFTFLRDRHRWLLFGRPRHLSREQHERRARRGVEAIASLGPTFIKLAQMISSRADLLPEPYLSEVSRLQDDVAPVPVAAIEAAIERELGEPLARVFDSFDPAPLASASLAQVHRARIGGQELVVKVLRPGVERVIALDLRIGFRILSFLNLVFPHHLVRALISVFREFEQRIREETDLRKEAANTEHFRRLFA
jgi:predicted unusual protein kinase regulating ubiquinone biosynthesis (AarF/ABC1/UbiB family)